MRKKKENNISCQLEIRWKRGILIVISQRFQNNLAEFLYMCQEEETTKNSVGLHNEYTGKEGFA